MSARWTPLAAWLRSSLCLLAVWLLSTSAVSGQDGGEVIEARDRVLSRTEFRAVRQQAALESATEAKQEAPQRQRSSRWRLPGGLENILGGVIALFSHGVAFVMLAAVLIAIAFFIIQAVRSGVFSSARRKSAAITEVDAEDLEETVPELLPKDVALQRADELAAAGRFREAVAVLLASLLGEVERRGWIRYRKGLTHYDYVRVARQMARTASDGENASALQSFLEGLRELIRIYEPLGFGRRPAEPTHYQQSVARFRQALEGRTDVAAE